MVPKNIRLLIERCADNDLIGPCVLITGCREFPFDKRPAVCEAIHEVVGEIVESGAAAVVGDCPTGVDSIVRTEYVAYGYAYLQGMAMWSMGKSAGPRRNRLMAKVAGLCLAFWDGESKGTLNCMREARAHGVEVWVWQDGNWRVFNDQ